MKCNEIINILIERYSTDGWWPHGDRFEIMIGAILVQRTNWANVQRAIGNLKVRSLIDPHMLSTVLTEELEMLIRPSGFYRQKAQRLKSMSMLIEEQFDSDLDMFFEQDYDTARQLLLSINGIGQETADTILLYAGDKPVFIEDNYSKRIYCRLSGESKSPDRTELQKHLLGEQKITSKLCKDAHSAIVTHCKTTCKAVPLCKQCFIKEHCLSDSERS